MAGGEIIAADTYGKLLASTPEFQELVNAHENTSGLEKQFATASGSRPMTSEDEIQQYVETQKKVSLMDQLIKKEEREEGDTGFKSYLQYLRPEKGLRYFVFQALLHLSYIIGQAVQSYWLAVNIQNSHVSRLKLFLIYSGIGSVLPVLLFVRSYTIAFLGRRQSEYIFSTLMKSIFRAPMSFYDSTPVGRILSRVRILFVQHNVIFQN